MKLALITPKSAYFTNDETASDFFKKTFGAGTDSALITRYGYWTGGHLGLLIIAALTPSNYDIHYIDENCDEIDFDADYDIVGITAMTQQATRAYEIADTFRGKGIKVIIGGIHATTMQEEAKKHADAVVIGEAEHAWPVLLEDVRTGTLKPFYSSKTPVDLSLSPMPRYDLLKKYDYKMIWVQTTRGCPRDCDFCAASNVYGKKYRHKTIPQVLNELNYIRGLWNEPLINFADDNMFVNRAYSSELINKLRQMELRWTAQTDVSVVEQAEFLDLLQNSNCKLLLIGFETLSKEGQLDKHGWKRKRIDNYPDIIRKIQSRGIGVLGAFILGLDTDSNAVIDEVSDFIISNRLYASQISVLTPLPGTRLRERLQKEGRILDHDWSDYTFADVNFIPKQMTTAELQDGLLEVYRRVYSKEARAAVFQHFKEIYLKLHVQRVDTINDNT